MNDMVYDSIRTDEMDFFIKRMLQIGLSYGDDFFAEEKIAKNIIYHQMCTYGLKPNDFNPSQGSGHNIEQYFDHWVEQFAGHSGIEVFVSEDWKYFCQFINDFGFRLNGDYIKLYVPLDLDHLYQGAIQLFDFIERIDAPHNSKIGKYIRSDNVVIRLNGNDYESAKKIIDYINQNQYIKNGLNPTNPFISNINGIGYMKESGISYNSEMAKLLSIYIKKAITEKKDVSLDDFKNWITISARVYSPKVADEVLRTFNISIDEKNREVVPKEEANKHQKATILNDALTATYQKHGAYQTREALVALIERNFYGYFFRGDENNVNYRERLANSVTSEEIKKHVLDTVSLMTGQKVDDVRTAAEYYVQILFQKEMVVLLDKICSITTEKYGYEHTIEALEKFCVDGKTEGFSRFPSNGDTSVNYRAEIVQFDPNTLVRTMQSSLIFKGVTVEEFAGLTFRQTIEMYSKLLEETMVKDAQKSAKI